VDDMAKQVFSGLHRFAGVCHRGRGAVFADHDGHGVPWAVDQPARRMRAIGLPDDVACRIQLHDAAQQPCSQ
jgi:hypothetical protein